MPIKKDIMWRIVVCYVLVVIVGGAIVFQIFRIQNFQGEYYRSLSDSLNTRLMTIEAERGNIFSEDGRLLATSLPYFNVWMDLKSEAMTDKIFNENVDSLATSLASFFKDKSFIEYKKYLKNGRLTGRRSLKIARNITYLELQELKQFPFFKLGRYKSGMVTKQINKRQNPFKVLAHRTIGYSRDDIHVGIEGSFDETLKGIDGKRLMQKIAGGVWMPLGDENQIEPKNGHDLELTLDVNLQDISEHALLKALKTHNADHGSVILMEVKTGKIKAIANLGQTNGKFSEKYNYAVGEGTEPGSTFKLASVMALLEAGYVNLDSKVDLNNGTWKVHNRTVKDAKWHPHTEVNLRKAFEMSSNVGIAKLVYKHFNDKKKDFRGYLSQFRLDQQVGIEIRGEGKPNIKTVDDESWSKVTLPWMSFGYEVELTPLQILTFYNAVANNGKMMKPYLVSKVKDFGETVKTYEPIVLDNSIASANTVKKAKELLVGVVKNGTAKNLQSDKFLIAGKTGTSHLAQGNQGYGNIYQSSFAGFFPAENPVYSCIVVINNPRGEEYYGGLVAGPVFKEIADKYFASRVDHYEAINENGIAMSDDLPSNHKGYNEALKSTYNKLKISSESDDKSNWVSAAQKQKSVDLIALNQDENKVPNLKGMSLRDALYLIENLGLKVEVKGAGHVSKQSINAGDKLVRGNKITIWLS